MDIPKPRFLNSTFLPFLFLCLFIKQNSRNKGTLIIKGLLRNLETLERFIAAPFIPLVPRADDAFLKLNLEASAPENAISP